MKGAPVISVVMSVYNGEKFLEEAIESILNQTYKNFEFIIINDGSTDASLEVLSGYQRKNKKIVLISRENKGLISSLNEGIKKSKGKYIARMDADDVSLPTRFEDQINYIESNNLDMCGTATNIYSDCKYLNKNIYPETDHEIKFSLMFSSPFAHSSVMMKKSIFRVVKYEDYKYAEDYKLWIDVALSGFIMGNMNKILLRYRLHDGQISNIYKKLQRNTSKEIAQFYLKNFNNDSKEILRSIKEVELKPDRVSMRNFVLNVKKYTTRYNIGVDLYLKAVRFIFRHSKIINLNMYIEYLALTRGLEKNTKIDIFLFFQSALRLNYTKPAYDYLNNFRKFFRLN